MKINLYQIVLPFLLLVLIFVNDKVAGENGISRIKKIAKKFIKGIIKDSKGDLDYDDYPPEVYAVPAPDGHGYVVHGLEDHHTYNPYGEEGVDVYQIPRMWSGRLRVPNFLRSEGEGYEGDQRVVKGWDNRLGFRVAVPYFGDFQYLREIGPGRYIDKLGPGKFKYPGINDKRRMKMAEEYHKKKQYGYQNPSSSYGPPSYPTGHHEKEHYGGDNESSYYIEDHYAKSFKEEVKEATTVDPLASLRNYPWNEAIKSSISKVLFHVISGILIETTLQEIINISV